MAARTWCSTQRVLAPHLLAGIEALLTPPVHNIGGVLRAAFPHVAVLAMRSSITWCADGTAMVSIAFSYTGPETAPAVGDVERILGALQSPPVIHKCPPVADTLSWVRCGNDGCTHSCAAPGAVGGWFLVECCGLSHLPAEALSRLAWRCSHCAP